MNQEPQRRPQFLSIRAGKDLEQVMRFRIDVLILSFALMASQECAAQGLAVDAGIAINRSAIGNARLPGIELGTHSGNPTKRVSDINIRENGLPLAVVRKFDGEEWHSFVPVVADRYFKRYSGWLVTERPETLLVRFPEGEDVWFRERKVNAGELPVFKSTWRVDRDWVDLVTDNGGVYGDMNDVFQSATGWRVICGFYNTGRSFVDSSQSTQYEQLTACVLDSPAAVRYIFEGANNARLKARFENNQAGRIVTPEPVEIAFLEFAQKKPSDRYPPLVLSKVVDLHGNETTFSYEQTGNRSRLKSISSNFGARIDFSYSGGTVTASAPSGNATYVFSVSSDAVPTYRLDKVTGLDGITTSYEYSSTLEAKDGACSNSNMVGARMSGETTSAGASFQYRYRLLGRIVRRILPGGVYTSAACWPALSSLAARSSPLDTYDTWTVTYSPEGKELKDSDPIGYYGPSVTKVRAPNGELTEFVHVPQQLADGFYRANDRGGLIAEQNVYSSASSLVEKIEYSWRQFSVIADPGAKYTNCDMRTYACGVFDSGFEYWNNQIEQLILHRYDLNSGDDGVKWAVNRSTFDVYGNPSVVTESTPGGGVRRRDLTYLVDEKANILHQPKDETVTIQ